MTAAVQIARVDLTAADLRDTAKLTDDADAARRMGLRAGAGRQVERRRTCRRSPLSISFAAKTLTGSLSVSIPH